MEEKRKANTDTTYCTNEECKEKCFRHAIKYDFEVGELYIFQFCCEKWEKEKNGI